MISILLFVSLAAHIVTFAILFRLMQQLQSIKHEDNSGLNRQLAAYLEAIREENRYLEAALNNELNQGGDGFKSKTSQEPKAASDVHQANAEAPKTGHMDAEPQMSLEARVLHLYAEGWTADAIARKLNCGKTEAELIIKLQNNAHNNA
ncbi:hypothetical protein EU245_04680 [Lentibacillus lipolyticus]|nr:hypothetical protein EU245_04680 [Lentibacillus lipolyticus]